MTCIKGPLAEQPACISMRAFDIDGLRTAGEEV